MPQLSTKGKLVLGLAFLSFLSLIYILSSSGRSPIPSLPLFPTPTPVSTEIQSPNATFRQIRSYQVSLNPRFLLTSLPQTLPVYSASSTTIDLDAFTASVAAFLNLHRTTPTSRQWVSANTYRSLYQDYRQQMLNYSTDKSVEPALYSGPHPPSLSGAVSSAQKLVDLLPAANRPAINQSATQYYIASNSDTELSLTTSAKAEVINLVFEYQINGFPYRQANQGLPVFSVYVGQNNQIIKMTYSSQPLPLLSSPTEHPLLTLDLLQTQLNSGQGEVVSTDLGNITFNTTSLPPISLYSFQIEYHYNPLKNLVLPYFLLEGKFTSSVNKQETPVYLLLPAVSL